MVEPILFQRNCFVAIVLTLCALVVNSGCSLPWHGRAYGQTQSRQNPFTEATDAPAETSSQTEEESLADVFEELQEMGEIDPLAREKLTNDLRSVKAEHWPLMVQQFKSALAYQRQLAERESEPLSAPEVVGQAPRLPAKPQADVVSSNSLRPPRTEATSDFSKPLPPPPSGVRKDIAVTPVSYVSSTQPTHVPWRDELAVAIGRLEDSVNPNPGNTDEVHEQMRLRMLYLLVGRETDAMLPVPGASPAQQDYWSKQLFAMSSFLDNRQQPDDKRRAAGSLMHLDQARSKLAELATLQIRNLTFVDSVDGYGVYQRRELEEFRPGDPVTLYAEVENFRSDSTKEGYRTTLATSYEVVDASGQRVDGGQFPDVEDLCQNQRCDFHMQYGVALPTRIYPGEYQLRLTITDQLSHKIGQTSVPFVIVE